MPTRSALVAGLLLGLLAPARADTFKVSTGVGADLQDALDAAAAGDTVIVSGGPYVGNFTLGEGRDGLVIKGQATLDAQGGVSGLTINSSDVEVSGLTIRHSTGPGLRGPVAGPPKLDGLRVTRCTFINCGDDVSGGAVSVTGDDVVLENCLAEGCDGGFAVIGNAALVTRCTVLLDGEHGVTITGDDAQVISCTIDVIEDQRGIEVSGLNARILKNRVNNTDGIGISLEDGDGGLIESNTVTNISEIGISSTGIGVRILRNKVSACTDEGIHSTGADVVISRNRITVVGGDGIRSSSGDGVDVTKNRVDDVNDDAKGISVSGASAVIESNVVQDVAETGVSVSGSNATIRKNRVLRTAENDAGFEVIGNGSVVEDNRAKDCDKNGFFISGDDIAVIGNKALRCLDNGFLIFSTSSQNTLLEGNSALSCEGDGIENGGVGTVLRDNSSKKNAQDISNRTLAGASIIDGGGNSFVTGGFTTEPYVP